MAKEAYYRLLRVKPICGVLERKKIDFRDYRLRLRSMDAIAWPAEQDSSTPSVPGGATELAEAGYVGTSATTAACHLCHERLYLTDFRATMHSPWAMHAWSGKSFAGCSFLLDKLRQVRQNFFALAFNSASSTAHTKSG